MNVAAGEVQIPRSLDLHWCKNFFTFRYPWKTRLTSTSKVGPKSSCLSATTIHVAVTQTFPETKHHVKYFTKTHLPWRWGHSFGLPQAPAWRNLLHAMSMALCPTTNCTNNCSNQSPIVFCAGLRLLLPQSIWPKTEQCHKSTSQSCRSMRV